MSDIEQGDVTLDQKPVIMQQDEDIIDPSATEPEDENHEPSEGEVQGEVDVEEDAEPLVTFGDEKPEEEQTEQQSVPFKQMRKALREKEKALREMQKQIDAMNKPEPAKQLRKKPTLADHDYNEEAFESDLEKYTIEKREIEREHEKVLEQKQAVETEFKEKVSAFNDSYASLSYKDKDDAYQEVLTKFNERQQGVIVDAVDNPAMIVYALGKNPKKLEELSKITNLVKLSSQLGKLETQMKVTNRRPKTSPDKSIKGSSGVSAVTDRTREKLVEEARKTKNRSKLLEYDRKLKAKKG